jgi:putative phosphoesterase
MRIAVLSDTHNRYANVERALKLLEAKPVDLILHCGDIEDTDVIELFPANTHFVFGNCDDDRDGLRQAMKKTGATLHEPFGELKLDGVPLAFIHSDDRRLFQDLENSGAFHYLFYGHSHIAREHRTGPTRVINPGALHRATTKTFIIVDLATGNVENLVVD